MRFIDALALVFSRSRRIAHGAWDSWARDEIQHHNDVLSQRRQHSHFFSLEGGTEGKTRTNVIDMPVGPHGKATSSKSTVESSPFDLNEEWQAFKDAQGGDGA